MIDILETRHLKIESFLFSLYILSLGVRREIWRTFIIDGEYEEAIVELTKSISAIDFALYVRTYLSIRKFK